MGYADYLKQMLRPVAIYDLDSGAGAAELDVQGDALDDLFSALTQIEAETIVLTASGFGLAAYEEILPYTPLGFSAKARRAAIAALMRVDESSFTLSALSDTLRGIGLEVAVAETDSPLTVNLSFPEVRGIPDDFEELKKRIEMILPCHLQAVFTFIYLLWFEFEEYFSSWGELEALAPTWRALEKYQHLGG